jgi:adenine-specific DNA-methyltransferase
MSRIFTQDAFRFLADLKPKSVDLVVSSPPYFMGKSYDSSNSVADFLAVHEKLLAALIRVLKPGGSICWQVGHHVRNNIEIPLDALVYSVFAKSGKLKLRNRIIWTFGHGEHCGKRFSGRHETVLWFTKGSRYYFNLDSVRVPQKYPGKRHYKGPKRGKHSGNPLGKNPGDVWDMPNVKAAHVEKTAHPCQFPVALAQRLVRALCRRGGVVIDPFLGSGSTAIAAAIERRRFRGCDHNSTYVRLARSRLRGLRNGTLRIRPLGLPVLTPPPNNAVSKRPAQWAKLSDLRV